MCVHDATTKAQRKGKERQDRTAPNIAPSTHRTSHRWLNMEVKSVWALPSSRTPTAETLKCSIMNRDHWRELLAQVQAPKTWFGIVDDDGGGHGETYVRNPTGCHHT